MKDLNNPEFNVRVSMFQKKKKIRDRGYIFINEIMTT